MLTRIIGYLLYASITARQIRQFYMDRAHTGHLQHGQVLTLRSFIIDIVRRFSIATVHLMGVLFYYCSRQTSIVLHTQDSFPQIGTLLLHLSRDGNLRLIPSTYLRESAQLHYMTLQFFLDYQQIKLQLLVIHVQIGYVYINLYQDSLLEIQTQIGSTCILHGWVSPSLLWHQMLMRSLFGVILGLISYNSFAVFYFQESLAIRCILCFYPFQRILRLLVGIVGVVPVQLGFIDSCVKPLRLIHMIYLATDFAPIMGMGQVPIYCTSSAPHDDQLPSPPLTILYIL